MIHPTARIHSLAFVRNSTIGAGTIVWQFASVIRGSHVGNDCRIASCAIVDASTIGANSIVGHGASVHPGMRLGNDVFIGPGVVLCNDFWPVVSKDGFDADAILSGEVIVTEIGDGASIGADAIVLPGLKIGGGAMIAAGAVVDVDVPDGCLFRRNGTLVHINKARLSKVRRLRAARSVLPVAAE